MAKFVATLSSKAAAALRVVLILVVFLQPASLVSASPADVNIYNEIQGNTILRVNCGSFGERPLVYGEHFGWGFRASIWGYTKWTCGFRWGARTQEFFVWVDDGLWGTVPVRPCTHCVWRVRNTGFYRDGKYGNPIFVHPWL